MSKKIILSLLFLLILPLTAYAYTKPNIYVVTSTSDIQQEGTLRTVLQHACDSDGRDIVSFEQTWLDTILIHLTGPLVIPNDCKGPVTLVGSSDARTVLDASGFTPERTRPGNICTLDIYSYGNSVSGFTFVGNVSGAAVCIYGGENTISNSTMEDNLYGIIVSRIFEHEYSGMDGSFSIIMDNVIDSQSAHGIWIDTNDIIVKGNTVTSNGGAGIYVARDSVDDLIEENTIQYNDHGGVVLQSSRDTSGIMITHNQISKNYGNEAPIDLSDNGVTNDDILDDDIGPNKLLNFPEHVQSFQVRSGSGNLLSYFTWGVAFYDDNIELYSVASEDYDRKITHGGGDSHISDLSVSNSTFEIFPDASIFSGASAVTTIGFDGDSNTSEFSINATTKIDQDYDGIPDEREEKTSKINADSDGDGLPDPVEDRNRNGIWDKELGETCAYDPDTDHDGLSDFAETHGDGIYDKGRDTDPFNPDTDGDGLMDGEEDTNGNGIWEGYLGETSPLIKDSDGDGFNDKVDTCPAIVNPGQEPWYCGK